MIQTIKVNFDRLREERAGRGLKQLEVERACNIPHGRLSQFETGRSDPTPEMLNSLATFYKVKPTFLMADQGHLEVITTVSYLASLIGAEVKFGGTLNG